MIRTSRWILFLVLFCGAEWATARVLLDFDLSYLQEARASDSAVTRTAQFYSGAMMVDATGKEKYYLGATIASGSTQDLHAGTAQESLAQQDIVLFARWYMGRQRMFSFSGGYGFLSTADMKTSTTDPVEHWRGTSFYAKVGLAPQYGKMRFAVSLVYIQGNYTQKTVGTETSSASLQRSMLWPTVSVGYTW